MGCFSSKNKSSKNDFYQLCSYPRHTKVPVKVRNVSGSTVNTQKVSFSLSEPTLISSKNISLLEEKLLVSSCILPGIDPRGEYQKKCQDNCFYLYDNESILCCLFDGHGTEGEKVADFCRIIIEKQFSREKALLKVIFKIVRPTKFYKKSDEKMR